MFRLFTALVRLAGSGASSLALFGVLAVALVIATLIEARASFQAPADAVYRATWFAGLLFLLGLNAVTAVVRAWPWRAGNLGVVCVHAAVVLLLVGTWVTAARGVDGTLTVAEGATSPRVDLASRWVRVDDLPAVPARTGAEVRLADGTTVRVVHAVPAVARTSVIRTDGTTENPAVHFKLSKQQSSVDGWLLSRDAERSQVSYGPMTVRFAEVDSLPSNDDTPTLYVQVGGRQAIVPVKAGLEQRIGDTAYRVRIVEMLDRAVVKGKDVTQQAAADVNPAVKFEIVSDQGTEKHTAFANFPQFHTYVGPGQPPSAARVRYETMRSKSPLLTFYRLKDQSLVLRIKNLDFPCKVGREIPTPWGLSVKVEEVAEKARVASAFQPALEGSPALLVACEQEDAWVALNEDATLAGHVVRYESGASDLAFSVKLEKLELGIDPDTGRPAALASDVQITDGGSTTALRIPASEAVAYGGYSFCQAGYEPRRGKAAVSFIRVIRDPGGLVKHAGGLLLVLGLLWMFYLQPILARRPVGAPAAGEAPSSASPLEPCKVVCLVLAAGLVLLSSVAVQAAPADAPSAPGSVPAPAASGAPTVPSTMPPGHPAGGGAPMPSGHPTLDESPSEMAPPSGHGGHAGAGKAPSEGGPPGGHGGPDMSQAPPAGPTTATRSVRLDMDAARRLPVQMNGRVRTLDSLAREAVLTVTGRERFDDRDPVDLVLSWTVDAATWSQRDVVFVPSAALKRALKLDVDQARFNLKLLMNSEGLRTLAQSGRVRKKHANPLEREAVATMARVSTLGAFVSGRALTMVPPAGGQDTPWLGPADVQATDPASAAVLMRLLTEYQAGDDKGFTTASEALEKAMREKAGAAYPSSRVIGVDVACNRFQPNRAACVAYLLAVLFFALGGLLRPLRFVAGGVAVLGLVIHTAGLVARGYVDGRMPLASLQEAAVMAAWGAAFLGLGLAWRNRSVAVAAMASAVAGLLLVVALVPLASFDPTLVPLLPALSTNGWLSAHVFFVTVGYAALALAAGLGHAVLWARVRGADEAALERLARHLLAALQLGVLLLACGAVVGNSVWASDARGALERGDPRDVWALAVLLGYLLVLHAQAWGWLAQRGLAVTSVVAFVLVVAAAWAAYSLPGPWVGHGLDLGARNALLYVAGEIAFVAATARGRHAEGQVST